MPAVSVVIPLFNKGPHIGGTLRSVLAQTVEDVEVIVVEGGSTDEGPEVVRGFRDPRIRMIHAGRRGASAARNAGIEAASSDLVAFLDADDEWMPRHLEVILGLRERYPCAGLYATGYTIREGSKTRVASLSPEIPPAPRDGLIRNYFLAAIRGDPPVMTSAVAVPRQVLVELGGFNTAAWYGEDVDLWGRIALRYPVALSRKITAVYHKEALNRACSRREPIEEHVFVATAKRAIEGGEVPPALREDLLEYVASRSIQTAFRNLEAGRPDLARANLKGCRTRRLWKLKYWALLWAYLPPGAYRALEPQGMIEWYHGWRERVRGLDRSATRGREG